MLLLCLRRLLRLSGMSLLEGFNFFFVVLWNSFLIAGWSTCSWEWGNCDITILFFFVCFFFSLSTWNRCYRIGHETSHYIFFLSFSLLVIDVVWVCVSSCRSFSWIALMGLISQRLAEREWTWSPMWNRITTACRENFLYWCLDCNNLSTHFLAW